MTAAQIRSCHDKILTNIDHFQSPRNSVPRANLIHESERTNKNHISCECTSQIVLFATKSISQPQEPKSIHSQRNAPHLRLQLLVYMGPSEALRPSRSSMDLFSMLAFIAVWISFNFSTDFPSATFSAMIFE